MNAASSETRFEFGRNWQRFLPRLNEERIAAAESSLTEMLGLPTFRGLSFLDIGCGSGLFSLAARRLGARVRSFDADQDSVHCTLELRKRFFPEDEQWDVGTGSVLDQAFVNTLGMYDIVYAWGVLHHTGALWDAVAASCSLTRPSGKLFIAVYNDQGAASKSWTAVKRTYNRSPRIVRSAIVAGVGAYFGARATVRTIADFPRPRFKLATSPRGMSRWYDLIDWVGGYPFEVSKPEQVFDFVMKRGFQLEKLVTRAGGLGCNEYVFLRR